MWVSSPVVSARSSIRAILCPTGQPAQGGGETPLTNFRATTVGAKSACVAISRARQHAAIYLDSKEKLANAIEPKTGERQAAISSSNEVSFDSGKSAPSRGIGRG
ncbi:hypothetical protein NOVOSPHI9U_260019 [Novosphingobium sp. 9U]|nr:hypothetical protein NOVOSPHI9U_260019 [Novosphingobium sp. 9U]